MESSVQVLAEKLFDIVDDYETMGEKILKTVEGHYVEKVREAFCKMTAGEFVTHELFPNCKILNKFPNVVIKKCSVKEFKLNIHILKRIDIILELIKNVHVTK